MTDGYAHLQVSVLAPKVYIAYIVLFCTDITFTDDLFADSVFIMILCT